MNKKFFILTALLTVMMTINTFAQAPLFKGAIEYSISGDEWNTWTDREKITYVIGWITAMKACNELTLALNGKQDQSVEFQKIIELYNMMTDYSGTSSVALINEINAVYSNPQFKKAPIWLVILTVTQTVWWK